MTSYYSAKKAHSLHRCHGSQEFIEKFEAECGQNLGAFVGRFVSSNRLAGSILAGSIPLGIGTSASDIDILVLIDSLEALHRPSGNEGGVVFSSEFAGEGAKLVVAEVVTLLNSIEVDLQFVLAPQLRELAKRISGAGVSLNAQDIAILSRIKTGWVLTRTESLDEACGGLLRDNSLEVHCAVTYLVSALQDLEDARAALEDNLLLAHYLGRVSVERSFASYFSSKGYAFLGAKWLRFVQHYRDSGAGARDEEFRRATTLGLSLLFAPVNDDKDRAAQYLDRVAKFLEAVRGLIEVDVTFRVALKVCPQI